MARDTLAFVPGCASGGRDAHSASEEWEGAMTGNEKRRISRRETLGLISGAAVAAVIGCGDDDPSATPEATDASSPTRPATGSPSAAAAATPTAEPVACVITLEQTEGPYFVDERLDRSDLTSDPTDGSVKAGV